MAKHIWEFNKTVIVETTRRCPYKCTYCIASVNKNSMNDFELDGNVNKAVPFLKSFGEAGWSLEFTGGEPFVHHDAITVMNELVETCHVFVLTNGRFLKNIEYELDERVSLLVAWHPTQIEFENFYWNCNRENLKYFYIVHPSNIESGIVEKHFAMFEDLAKKPFIGFFKGFYKGNYYNYRSSIYKQFPQTFAEHLENPRQVIFMDIHGKIHSHYNFNNIGNINSITPEWANKHIEYIRHNDY